MAGNTEIYGLEDLLKTFDRVPHDMKNKTALRMVASGGGVLRKEAKSLALSQGLKRTGALIRNIAIKRERNVPDGVVQYNLGVRHGRNLTGRKKRAKFYQMRKDGLIHEVTQGDPSYWIFLEFGHRIVGRATGNQGTGNTTYTTTLRNGKKVTRTRKYKLDSILGRRRNAKGFYEPHPFIQPSLENKRAEALAAMEARLLKDLERAGQ